MAVVSILDIGKGMVLQGRVTALSSSNRSKGEVNNVGKVRLVQ